MKTTDLAEKEIDSVESKEPTRNTWLPKWIIDVGHGCKAGLTIDDGCFVMLLPNKMDQWRPTHHIPKDVARKIAELLDELRAD